MKKIMSVLLALLMLVTMLPMSVMAADSAQPVDFAATATTPGFQLQDVFDNEVSESEKNNDWSTADTIKNDQTMWGYTSTSDKKDYEKFTISQDYVELDIYAGCTTTLSVKVYNSSKKEIAKIDFAGKDEYNQMYYFETLYLPKGTYYIVVAGQDMANYTNYEYFVHLLYATHNHTAATPVIENYKAPTVTKDGGYNSTTYCSVCNYKMNSEYFTLSKTGNIMRIYGNNRSATALKAADALKNNWLGVTTYDYIILASGTNFADALAGSYLAAEKNAPILLHTKSTAQGNLDYILQNLSARGTVYILGGTAAVPQEVEDELTINEVSVVRLYGDNRFTTNLRILEEAGVQPGQEILVCTGYNFADSLSASATGLPMLLVNSKTNELTEEQHAFLADLASRSSLGITILGGTSAVSSALEGELGAYADSCYRIAGKSRYETSALIAERYFASSTWACVAYGKNFPDGLSGGPLAYAGTMPMLLVDKNDTSFAHDYVKERGIIIGYVMGGTGVIADATVSAVFD